MAVTPEEAAELNDAAERKSVEEMEKTIDGILNKEYRTGTSVPITFNTLKQAAGDGYTERALTEVKLRFKDAGWQIKKNKTRLGGYTLVFSARTRTEPSCDPREHTSPPPWYEDRETYPQR